jgi:hypothetical protein
MRTHTLEATIVEESGFCDSAHAVKGTLDELVSVLQGTSRKEMTPVPTSEGRFTVKSHPASAFSEPLKKNEKR